MISSSILSSLQAAALQSVEVLGMDIFWENPTSIRSEISVPQGMIWSNYSNLSSAGSGENYCVLANVDRLELLHPADLLSSSSLENIQGIVDPCEASLAIGETAAEMVLYPSNCMDLSNCSALDLDLLQYHQEALRSVAVVVNSDHHNNFMRSQGGGMTAATLIADAPAFHQTAERFTPSIDSCKADDLSTILYSCENHVQNNLSCSANISSGDSESRGSIEAAASQSSSNPDRQQESLKGNAGAKRKLEEHLSSTADILQSKSSANEDQVFQISFRSGSKNKKSKSENKQSAGPSSIDFGVDGSYVPDTEAIAQVKEMIYRAAALRPVNLGLEEPFEKPKRKNVRISSDPQTVAARHRRERIGERLRILQRLVPGGTKMDTASMLDEAASYLKFLKSQVRALETLGGSRASSFNGWINSSSGSTVPFHLPMSQTFPIPQNLPYSSKP